MYICIFMLKENNSSMAKDMMRREIQREDKKKKTRGAESDIKLLMLLPRIVFIEMN